MTLTYIHCRHNTVLTNKGFKEMRLTYRGCTYVTCDKHEHSLLLYNSTLFLSCTSYLLIPSMFLLNTSLTWFVFTLIRLDIGCIVSYCSLSAVDSSMRRRDRKCKYAARLRCATPRPRHPLQVWDRERSNR